MTNRKIPDHVFYKLQVKILNGSFSPGMKFPSERSLSGEYKASRTTVREAVNRLEQLGLVKKIPQSGTYVNNFETEASMDLLINIMRSGEPVSSDILISLVEFRRLAEIYAVQKAMSAISREDIDALGGFIEIMKDNSESPELLSEMDYKIHFTFARIAKNLVIQLMFNSFKPVYRYYTGLFYRLDDAPEMSLHLHERLLDAIQSNDSEYAVYAMEKVLLYGENRIKEALGISNESRMIVIPNLE